MNKATKDIFFRILRNAMFGEHLNLEGAEDADMQEMQECFNRHLLLTVVADTILKLPEPFLPDEEQQNFIMTECGTIATQHREMNEMVVMTMQRLEAAGCSPVLLKGAGYASLYPIPNMRSVGDIDIYVDPENIGKAIKEVNSWCNAEEVEKAKLTGLHYEVKHDGIDFEIHYNASRPFNYNNAERYKALSSEYLQPARCDYAIINGEQIRVPGLPFNAYYCFMHIMQHLLAGGIGLRQLVDWAIIMHHMKVEDFPQELLADNELKAWQSLGGILVKQLGLDKEQFPLYDERQAMRSQGPLLDTIIEGESFKVNIDVLGEDIWNTIFKRKGTTYKFVLKYAKMLYTLHPSISYAFLKRTFFKKLKLKQFRTITQKDLQKQ